MLETEGGVEAAVAARVRVGWRKFKEISGMISGMWEGCVDED